MKKEKKIVKLVNKYREKFKKAEKSVAKYREQWSSLDDRLRSVFEVLKREHEKEEFYSTIFIQDDDFGVINQEIKNKKHFAFRFGARPLNISEIEYDPSSGRPKKFKQEIEDGGALFFSQGIKGEVLVYLLPAKNKLIKKTDKVLMLKRYSKPSKVSEKKIRKHLSQFFWFSFVTSYMADLSLLDRWYIIYYKLRSRTLKLNWPIILPALILIVSVIHLILFIIYVI